MDISLIFLIISLTHTLLVFSVCIKMLLENRASTSFLAWMFLLFSFPFGGLVLYLFFGINWRKSKKSLFVALPENIIKMHFSSKIKDQTEIISKIAICQNNKSKKISSLALNAGYAFITDKNSVDVYDNGEDLFDKMIEDLENAKESIHMEYFIWKSDKLGCRIKDVLIKKRKENVSVRLIFDGLGSMKRISPRYKKELREAGIKFLYFNDPFSIFMTRLVNYRNHRKIVVIDGCIGYTGGMNIGQEYIDGGKSFDKWKDVHMRICGESVSLLQNVFACDWYNAGGSDILYFSTNKEITLGREPLFKELDLSESLDDIAMQIITSGPDSKWDSIHRVYAKMIAEAEKEVLIQSPYFVPDMSIISALENAALSGVKIKLMITGRPDKRIPWWVAQTYFDTLLQAGVEIYLYKKGFLHSKVLIIDGDIVSSGTCNMDIRSFLLHYEVNTIIYERSVAEVFRNIFYNDVLESEKISIDKYKKRSIFVRLRNSLFRIISPAL